MGYEEILENLKFMHMEDWNPITGNIPKILKKISFNLGLSKSLTKKENEYINNHKNKIISLIEKYNKIKNMTVEELQDKIDAIKVFHKSGNVKIYRYALETFHYHRPIGKLEEKQRITIHINKNKDIQKEMKSHRIDGLGYEAVKERFLVYEKDGDIQICNRPNFGGMYPVEDEFFIKRQYDLESRGYLLVSVEN